MGHLAYLSKSDAWIQAENPAPGPSESTEPPIRFFLQVPRCRLPSALYQTWHAFWLTIGCPALHENAFWNSGMFCTVPFTRKWPGECGSVIALCLNSCGDMFSHHTCANPRNSRCSGVNPSIFSALPRSEERRVGKECRSRWSP